ncbi:MAG: hypothetical protein ACM3PE_11245 [Deltaproteobacteria bacterium]
MPVRPRHDPHAVSTRRKKEEQKIEWQRTRNNLIGILVAVIIIAFALDLGGIATSAAHFLFRSQF